MTSDAERDPIEMVISEILERVRAGEHPSIEEYAQAHPEFADELSELLPAILSIESAKAS